MNISNEAFERMRAQLILEQRPMRECSSGELAEELLKRLVDGTEMKLTNKGVRVTHRDFIDKLLTAEAVDKALSYS